MADGDEVDLRDMLADLRRAVADDCEAHERGHGRRLEEVSDATEAIVEFFRAATARVPATGAR